MADQAWHAEKRETFARFHGNRILVSFLPINRRKSQRINKRLETKSSSFERDGLLVIIKIIEKRAKLFFRLDDDEE